ncbi:hypothetical protein T484DRAFT_1898603 [Baffinella frigidus]|nr:hypothetical protein T484DRAFT_1898603 [Cryptophyta sp. CCMP2293]
MQLRCLLLPPVGLPDGAVLVCDHCDKEEPLSFSPAEAKTIAVDFTIKPSKGLLKKLARRFTTGPAETSFSVKIVSREAGKATGEAKSEVEWVVSCIGRTDATSVAVLLPPRGDGAEDSRLEDVLGSFFGNLFGQDSLTGANAAVEFLLSDFAQIYFPHGEGDASSLPPRGPLLQVLGEGVEVIARTMRLDRSPWNRVMVGTSVEVVKMLPRESQKAPLWGAQPDLAYSKVISTRKF